MYVRTACKLSKRFPKYDQKIFMNVVTDVSLGCWERADLLALVCGVQL